MVSFNSLKRRLHTPLIQAPKTNIHVFSKMYFLQHIRKKEK